MSSRGLGRFKGLSFAALLITLAAIQTGVSAQSAQQPPAPRAAAAKTLKVRVKRNGAYFVSVRAKAVPLTQIAAELSRRLKAPVELSRVMEKQKVTIEFEDLPLETALQMLAPLPFVYYDLQGGSAAVCREIYLSAYNEPVPVPKFENKNVSFVMQGDTEIYGDDGLQVSYNNHRLTVRGKKQSLSVVLDRIATVMGVNLVMKEETDATVDIDFKEATLEEAIAYFPPSVHLRVRKDIQRIHTVPLLVELVN